MKKPLKILVLDNTREEKSFGSKNLVYWALKTSPEGSEIIVRRSPDHDLPPVDIAVDAIILSGSVTSCVELSESWIKPYDDFIAAHITKGTPMLGVCYGHQAIARYLFRQAKGELKLGKAADAEYGWQEIRKVGDHPFLESLPQKFNTYESHYEEVSELPPGAVLLASSERCLVQAFQVEHKPIFGIQFHPEYSIDEAEASLAQKLKKGVRKDWILNPGKGSALYDENVGKVIFGNFFRIAAERRRENK